jgi:steroid delta-isomerase-like uncharacterized protein
MEEIQRESRAKQDRSQDDATLLQAQSTVRQWIAAFNAHDVAALVALYADDAELFDSGMKRRRHGRHEIELWFRERFRAMPTITYVPHGSILYEDEGRAAITWQTRGQTPRLLGQAWLARPFQVDGVSVFTLRASLITRQRGYYDHLAAVEQALPVLKWLLPARF